MVRATSTASSSEQAIPLGGWFMFSSSSSALKRSRSSARSIESGSVPMMGTPDLTRPLMRFSGVWPPN